MYLKQLEEYRNREIKAYQSINLEDVDKVMQILENARLTGKRIFICGNGGSASTASHFCCDFNKCISENKEYKYNFECLSDNIPTLTAISNDIGYEEVFRFPLKNKMQQGDIFIGISGSGNSLNVINGMKYARSIGGITIALVGYDGGELKQISDYCIHVNINDMQISEDIHMILDHMIGSVLINE